MGTAYAIYDTETANLTETFPTLEEALAMVKPALDEDGPDSIEGWAVGQSDLTGEVLTGRKLIAHASGDAV